MTRLLKCKSPNSSSVRRVHFMQLTLLDEIEAGLDLGFEADFFKA